MSLIKTSGFDLNMCIDYLRDHNELLTVKRKVDPKFEAAGIASRYEGKKPILFEKIKGSTFPLFTGLYWNRQTLAGIFGTTPYELSGLIRDAVIQWHREPVEPEVTNSAPANEVVMSEPDLNLLPVPTHFAEDGGPYFLSPVVIARDPDTGIHNASVNRLMVTGPRRLTMLMDMGRHLRDYYERAEARGEALEITINNGVDPTVHIASLVPAAAAPMHKNELGIASQLLGRPLELLRSQTVEVEGVANCQFIIEGKILPYMREAEGPCAEVTGYYAERADRYVVEVTAITHRQNAVFHTILPGKEVYNSVGLIGEANVCALVQSQVPEVRNVHFPYGGCGFYQAVVQIDKKGEGSQKNAILATFAAFPSLRIVIAIDSDVDIYNPEDVMWAISTRFDPERGIITIKDARSHELNPMTKNGVGTKIGLDATAPYPKPYSFKRAKPVPVSLEKLRLPIF
ncbi:MAG: UbiD family decarboxylase [Bacillota bacterium]